MEQTLNSTFLNGQANKKKREGNASTHTNSPQDLKLEKQREKLSYSLLQIELSDPKMRPRKYEKERNILSLPKMLPELEIEGEGAGEEGGGKAPNKVFLEGRAPVKPIIEKVLRNNKNR